MKNDIIVKSNCPKSASAEEKLRDIGVNFAECLEEISVSVSFFRLNMKNYLTKMV
ncbi:MAG: hypothetical protein IJA86_08750 [Clostridia bacterium]|nr:hypothetical protein [Clostridia bacterium]